MTNLNIEYAFNRLELAIRIDDKPFIIECCNELVEFDELPIRTVSLLYQILALRHLEAQCFLKSYQSIDRSIKLESTVNNQLVLDIIKAKIME